MHDPNKPDGPIDITPETVDQLSNDIFTPVDITPPGDQVQYISHQPTASQRKRMMAPLTRIAVQGKPNNRAYRRAEAAYKRKHPDPKPTAKGSPS